MFTPLQMNLHISTYLLVTMIWCYTSWMAWHQSLKTSLHLFELRDLSISFDNLHDQLIEYDAYLKRLAQSFNKSVIIVNVANRSVPTNKKTTCFSIFFLILPPCLFLDSPILCVRTLKNESINYVTNKVTLSSIILLWITIDLYSLMLESLGCRYNYTP